MWFNTRKWSLSSAKLRPWISSACDRTRKTSTRMIKGWRQPKTVQWWEPEIPGRQDWDGSVFGFRPFKKVLCTSNSGSPHPSQVDLTWLKKVTSPAARSPWPSPKTSMCFSTGPALSATPWVISKLRERESDGALKVADAGARHSKCTFWCRSRVIRPPGRFHGRAICLQCCFLVQLRLILQYCTN